MAIQLLRFAGNTFQMLRQNRMSTPPEDLAWMRGTTKVKVSAEDRSVLARIY